MLLRENTVYDAPASRGGAEASIFEFPRRSWEVVFYLPIDPKPSNYSAYPLFCPIAVWKALIYTCKLRAFALLLDKIEGNLSY